MKKSFPSGMHPKRPIGGPGKKFLYTAPGQRMHPGEEPCGWLHVATLLSGVSVADTVRDDVALWHETEAVVIEHATPLMPTANRWLDGAAATTAGAQATANVATMKRP